MTVCSKASCHQGNCLLTCYKSLIFSKVTSHCEMCFSSFLPPYWSVQKPLSSNSPLSLQFIDCNLIMHLLHVFIHALLECLWQFLSLFQTSLHLTLSSEEKTPSRWRKLGSISMCLCEELPMNGSQHKNVENWLSASFAPSACCCFKITQWNVRHAWGVGSILSQLLEKIIE